MEIAKPGYKTTEFWLTLAGGILPQLVPALPPTWQVAVPALLGAAYTLSRGLAKGAQPTSLTP